MTVLVGKAPDLVLHARTVARTNAFNLAREHRATIKTTADNVVRLSIGVRNPARHLLWMLLNVAHEAEHRRISSHASRHTVARLFNTLGKVDRAPIQARRRSGFEPTLWQFQLSEAVRQAQCRRISGSSRRVTAQSNMDLPIQESSRRQHHGPGRELDAGLGNGADHPFSLHHQVIHRLLKQTQIRLVLQPMTDRGLVQDPVCLSASGAHRRPLARIEHPKLNAGFIRSRGHDATHGIYFLDQMSFSDAANGRVATHLP